MGKESTVPILLGVFGVEIELFYSIETICCLQDYSDRRRSNYSDRKSGWKWNGHPKVSSEFGEKSHVILTGVCIFKSGY